MLIEKQYFLRKSDCLIESIYGRSLREGGLGAPKQEACFYGRSPWPIFYSLSCWAAAAAAAAGYGEGATGEGISLECLRIKLNKA